MHLYTKKVAAMQAIQLAVRQGYQCSSQGHIAASKMPGLVRKLSDRYALGRSRQAVYKDRKLGRTVYKLVIYPAPEYGDHAQGFEWWLLATNDDCPEFCWQDVRRNPVTFGDQYRLIRKTKKLTKQDKAKLKNHPNKKGVNQPVWTWVMSKDTEEYWAEAIRRSLAQKNDFKLRQCLKSIGRMPGFSGVREGRKKLYQGFLKAWRQHYPVGIKPPAFPYNHYTQFKEQQTVKNLQQFVSNMLNNDRTAMEQLRKYNANSAKRKRKAS